MCVQTTDNPDGGIIAVLYCAVLCCTVLYWTVLQYTTSTHCRILHIHDRADTMDYSVAVYSWYNMHHPLYSSSSRCWVGGCIILVCLFLPSDNVLHDLQQHGSLITFPKEENSRKQIIIGNLSMMHQVYLTPVPTLGLPTPLNICCLCSSLLITFYSSTTIFCMNYCCCMYVATLACGLEIDVLLPL